MFTSRYYNPRHFASRYFPKVGAGAAVVDRPGRATAGQRIGVTAAGQRSPSATLSQRSATTEAGEE